ncbi:MAG: DUF4856 domain-containing protein [Crocinitomicaceae bacterium]|nr:DUF4856 domain-containing protein [Crocinitomicaceae bacterium]|tara:strand:- start:5715 stop:6788 length:1074 start_codon:yes stop_codon:yes gene_type:complete
MKRISYLLMSVMCASILFTSCSTDDDSSYTVPDTYTFTDDDGNSTVSYSGQTARKDMLGEITTYMKTGNSGAVLDAQEMKNMYANDVNGTDYFSYSSKDLKSKTGNGRPDATNIQAYFETLMDGLAAASSGTDGEIIDGYLQSSTTGQEWVQLIEKGLMGACFHHNISTYYLGADKMNVDNTTPEEGEYYTEMEHHWDEAYGYFTDDDYDGERFWSKYAGGSREALLGTQTALYEAFRTGRAAISADDMDTRDEQISVIREYMELAVGGTAIYYLNKGYANLSAGDPVGVKNHHLAEAEAFIHGLKFGGEPSFSGVEIDDMMSAMSNYNNLSGEDILSIRNQIATGLGISDSDRDNL